MYMSSSFVWCRANQAQQQDPGSYILALLQAVHSAHLTSASVPVNMGTLKSIADFLLLVGSTPRSVKAVPLLCLPDKTELHHVASY